jgi:hypothetical protein
LLYFVQLSVSLCVFRAPLHVPSPSTDPLLKFEQIAILLAHSVCTTSSTLSEFEFYFQNYHHSYLFAYSIKEKKLMQ